MRDGEARKTRNKPSMLLPALCACMCFLSVLKEQRTRGVRTNSPTCAQMSCEVQQSKLKAVIQNVLSAAVPVARTLPQTGPFHLSYSHGHFILRESHLGHGGATEGMGKPCSTLEISGRSHFFPGTSCPSAHGPPASCGSVPILLPCPRFESHQCFLMTHKASSASHT